MTLPAIGPMVSPTAPIIFWKQVETSVIEVGFRGGVVARLLLQRSSYSFVDRIVKGFQ